MRLAIRPPTIPYGAFELKATYQRNMFIANATVLMLIATALAVVWMLPEEPAIVCGGIGTALDVDIRVDIPPSIIVIPETPHSGGSVRVSDAVTSCDIQPIPDSLVLDDDVQLATRDELALIVGGFGDIGSLGEGQDGVGSGTGVNIGDVPDLLPGPEDFVAVEVFPEFVYRAAPEYPRLARRAGLTGSVAVKVLVDEDGKVLKAIVARSSGIAALDEAAIDAGYRNVFKPGIQNGRPVKVWVSYEVEFRLDR